VIWEFGELVRQLLRSRKGQGATEYLLVLAVASIVVLVVLAMVNGMRGAAPTTVTVDGVNQSITEALRAQFENMTVIVSP
jgi:Flp pilus assembly pilin Flp